MNPRDFQELSSFLDEVEKILKKVVDWRELLFPEEVRESVQSAWVDLQPRFGQVKANLPIVPDTRAYEAGLSGDQLDLKMKGFRGALQRFTQKGTIRLLKKLFEWMNIILKSLASLLPGAEALKEFKEALEKYVKDNEE